jgi:hypothetical protein
MRKITITRFTTGDDGTFGVLHTDKDFICFTGELPWRNNKVNESCIIAGEYLCAWEESQKFGMCYHLRDVPGRTDILIHAANYMGDKSKKLKSDVAGCIALGRMIKLNEYREQKILYPSAEYVMAFRDHMEQKAFILRIRDAYLPS